MNPVLALPWVIATRNAGKLHELRAFFASHNVPVTDLADVGVREDVIAEAAIESHDTFEANALAKARYFSGLLPGRMIIADDSGLAVDALNGDPGVRSKRWSERTDLHGAALDAANNAQLLTRLHGVVNRSARFVCAASWCSGPVDGVVRGEVLGRVNEVARGINGFGYDPHFVVEELGCTLGEALPSEKALVSHRGRALVCLLNVLRESGVLRESCVDMRAS